MSAETDPPERGSRRRRLWELPAAAHELLLGLSLPPELLRATVAQAIGRQRAARCSVGGTDLEVFFSCLHDLGTRNVVSDALHRLLDTRHALAVRRFARVREPQALRAAWSLALASPDDPGAVPATLWALLTHPLGATLQDERLGDLRHWLYTRARAGLGEARQQLAAREDGERLRAELAQARVATERAHAAAAERARADADLIARLRGELARAAAAATAPAPAPEIAPPAHPREAREPRAPEVPIPTRAAEPAVRDRAAPAPEATPAEAGAAEVGAAAPITIAGRNVLCVGGINGAVHRYRALVEARGGHFLHHDGGIEHNLQRLSTQLAAADLVLCQAGCVNHEAYRCVKAHCKRAGTECIYLDRPSLSRFARELGGVALPNAAREAA